MSRKIDNNHRKYWYCDTEHQMNKALESIDTKKIKKIRKKFSNKTK